MAKNQSGKKLRLRVITPTETKIDQSVNMVIMRCVDGDMGVQPGHQAHITALANGVLRALGDEDERKLVVLGGIAEVRQDVVTVLTDEAHWPEEIDLDRAEEAREHLERTLQERIDDRELQENQILLRRVLSEVEVDLPPMEGEEEE